MGQVASLVRRCDLADVSSMSSTYPYLPLPWECFIWLPHPCSLILGRAFQACHNDAPAVQGGTRLNLNKRSRPADSSDDGWQQWPGAAEGGGGDEDDDLQRAIAASMAGGNGEGTTSGDFHEQNSKEVASFTNHAQRNHPALGLCGRAVHADAAGVQPIM